MKGEFIMGYAADKSVLDGIIEVLKSLNDKQLRDVRDYVNDVASEPDYSDGFYHPLTKEEFLKRVDEGLDDFRNGRYEDSDIVIERLRKEFGF